MSAWAFLVICALVLAAPHIPARPALALSLTCAAWAVLAIICAAIAAAVE